jgi:serine/threonine protein kinase
MAPEVITDYGYSF